MSDEADRGNDTAEFFLDVAKRNKKPQADPHGIGMCLNCGAGVDGNRRWCDKDCADEWELHARR